MTRVLRSNVWPPNDVLPMPAQRRANLRTLLDGRLIDPTLLVEAMDELDRVETRVAELEAALREVNMLLSVAITTGTVNHDAAMSNLGN